MGYKYVLKFASQRADKLTPEIIIRGTWTSTALSLVLTLPALGLFVGLYQVGADIIIAAAIGFGLHFSLLAFSSRISKAISSIFED
jgi:hypothetical protein